jgi:hypothetical protein
MWWFLPSYPYYVMVEETGEPIVVNPTTIWSLKHKTLRLSTLYYVSTIFSNLRFGHKSPLDFICFLIQFKPKTFRIRHVYLPLLCNNLTE